MTQEYDVIVVGAGHNGLTCANYLAREGKRVAVVERGEKVGGMTSSGHMIPEAPNHLVTPCAIEVIFMRGTGIIEELDLAGHGYRSYDPDPSYAYLHPDGSSIALFRDPARTAEDMARLSRADGKNYLKFMEMIDALLDIGLPMMMSDPGRPRPGNILKLVGSLIRHRKLRRELTNLASGTADQIACEWFEHPASIALLTNIAGGVGPVDDDGNAAAYILFGLLHRFGVGKPIGSLQTLSNALASSLKAAGGEIHLNAAVEEIVIEGGATRGVRLEDGRDLAAKVVVATCDPRTAYKLTTPGGIDNRLMTRMEHAPAARNNVAPFLANVAMSGPLSLKRHQDLRHDDADLNKAVGLIGTPEQVRDNFTAARRGKLPEHFAISLSPLSNWDKTQAPEGESVAYVYMPGVAAEVDGGWVANRDRAMEIGLGQIAEFYDGFQNEIGRFVEAPPDRAKRLNATNGCVTHIDFTPTRASLKRPAYELGGPKPVVPGFFLGGAGIHPGGGVSGLPGKISADRVKHYLKKNS